MKEWTLMFNSSSDVNAWLERSEKRSEFFSHETHQPFLVRVIATESVNWTSWLEFIFTFVQEVYVPRYSKQVLQDVYCLSEEESEQVLPFVSPLAENVKGLHSQLSESLYERLVRYVGCHSPRNLDMALLYEHLFIDFSDWDEVVGYAIDEWQYELFFQERMHQLRQFVQFKEPQIKRVDVYDGKELMFYDQAGRSLTPPAQPQMMDGMMVSPLTQALLNLVPEKATIYSDSGGTHELFQVMNVFEERIELCSLDEFPHKMNLTS
ncbi:sporulation protein YtxC [Alkalibacillus salilacus]|uniref:Sporulation protein YtxC n=1 Tax=Alkalibacillus salilacus TaxID=284582 RepID=A0ABT9VGX0_9BACI|nr:sporulation protein YtxC [Alkalibacillus salilacus]MDQ0160208.1 hypothetical protein [Alkalibacillus salilacus]